MNRAWPIYPLIVPKAGSFFFCGEKIGCLLVHGYTSSPEEMLPLGKFLAQKGCSVLGVRLTGHGTHPLDLTRARFLDWMNSIQDGYFLLRGISNKVVIIGQSLGAMLALASTPTLSPFATIAISTPYLHFSLGRKFMNRWSLLFNPYAPKIHLRKQRIIDLRRESSYPAYPIFATRSLLELEKLQNSMEQELGEIHTPIILIQSRKSTSEESIKQITTRLIHTQYESIWHDDFNNSMVMDKHRIRIFNEIHHFIEKCISSENCRDQ